MLCLELVVWSHCVHLLSVELTQHNSSFRGWVTGWVGQSGVLTPRGATAVAPTQAPRAPNLICDLGVNKTEKIPIRQILSSLV